MELLKKYLNYAYNDVVEKLKKEQPSEGEWVENNTSLNSHHRGSVKMSELFEHGYGICRHLSAACLWIAEKAGLNGVILICYPRTLKNTEKPGTNEPIFKNLIDQKTAPAHAWVEIQTKEGDWIPADPTTGIVGDSRENFDVFVKANYIAETSAVLKGQSTPADTFFTDFKRPLFKPGEKTAKGDINLRLRGGEIMMLGKITEKQPKEEKDKKFNGPASIKIICKKPESSGTMGIKVINLEQ